MPVMLRRNLMDNQAGYYYINGANEMVVGVGIAPTSRRLQRHANLSQLTNQKHLGFISSDFSFRVSAWMRMR